MDLVKIPCPQCANMLINSQTGSDGQVRCTNCGLRFHPGVVGAPPGPESAESSTVEENRLPAAFVPPGRPPQPAGYGAASLTAYLFFGALAFGAVLQVVFATPKFFYGGLNWEGFWFLISFLALTFSEPLLGFILLRAARSLGRMDAAALEIAWRLHALSQPPPPPTGSDLPYILPCMAGGGVMVMAAIITTDQLGGDVGGLIAALVAGLLLFLLGLLFSDVRRFCFRATWLARAISTAVHPNSRAVQQPSNRLMMGEGRRDAAKRFRLLANASSRALRAIG